MAKWLNRSVVQAPRNNTNSHTISFTPAAAGSLLVLVMEGAVTHTVPTGWTRRAQALSSTELSVYTKTATAGESSFSTTHNGSNYPIGVVVYEFPSGSTWINAVSSTGVGNNGSNPTLTGLSGTNLLFGACGYVPSSASSITWTSPAGIVEDVDISFPTAATDGYGFSVAYVEDSAATSFAPASTAVAVSGGAREALTFAVKVVAGSTGPAQVSASGTWSYSGAALIRKTAKLAAAGTWSYASAAALRKLAQLSAAGDWSYSSNAVIRKLAQLLASGTWSYSSQAVMSAPPVGQRAIYGSGQWSYSGTATLRKTARVSAASTWSYSGSAVTKRRPKVVASGVWSYISSAALTTTRKLRGEGTWMYSGLASMGGVDKYHPYLPGVVDIAPHLGTVSVVFFSGEVTVADAGLGDVTIHTT